MPEQPGPPLRDMIKDAATSGLTYEQLAQRAARRGEKVSGSYLNNIVLGNVNRLPLPERLRAIAAALDVSYEKVRQAAIAQWLPGSDAAEDIERAETIEELRRLRDVADEALTRLQGAPEKGTA